ncbi:MAG: hypothetical protein BWY43_00482 [candidate division WS2 bacterium ADurb.Bin280]|uniref:Uncharacterized protein n=1 Tax=candidate division WS2 bacterium ADurb.Bin280 TaxID=1852829 RepID=A0A1V5SDD7_9BACT|nr:MAG: hypothetical protein BWY43_00482 [candidate division WS2 bacterium ADurb.Bin280]
MNKLFFAILLAAVCASTAQASTAQDMIKQIKGKVSCSDCSKNTSGITNKVVQESKVENVIDINMEQSQSQSQSQSNSSSNTSKDSGSAAAASAAASAGKSSASSAAAAASGKASASASSSAGKSSASSAAAAVASNATSKAVAATATPVKKVEVAVAKTGTLPEAGVPLAVPIAGSLGLSGASLVALRARAKAAFIAANL